MELRLYRLTDLQLVLYRRHLQLVVQHLLPVDVCKPRMLTHRLRVLLESQSLLCVLSEEALDEVFEELWCVFGEANEALPD